LLDLLVSQGNHYFKDLTPRWKGTAAFAAVFVHAGHELDFGWRVVTLAGSGIYLTTAFYLLASLLHNSPVDLDVFAALPAFRFVSPLSDTSIDCGRFVNIHCVRGHCTPPNFSGPMMMHERGCSMAARDITQMSESAQYIHNLRSLEKYDAQVRFDAGRNDTGGQAWTSDQIVTVGRILA
jgi:hypothetical protein